MRIRTSAAPPCSSAVPNASPGYSTPAPNSSTRPVTSSSQHPGRRRRARKSRSDPSTGSSPTSAPSPTPWPSATWTVTPSASPAASAAIPAADWRSAIDAVLDEYLEMKRTVPGFALVDFGAPAPVGRPGLRRQPPRRRPAHRPALRPSGAHPRRRSAPDDPGLRRGRRRAPPTRLPHRAVGRSGHRRRDPRADPGVSGPGPGLNPRPHGTPRQRDPPHGTAPPLRGNPTRPPARQHRRDNTSPPCVPVGMLGRACPRLAAVAAPGGPMPHDSSSSRESRTALRICPLCEATCGLTLTIEGTRVTGARGDRDDVFSQGLHLPQGRLLRRARRRPRPAAHPPRPQGRRAAEATWAEAFDAIAASPARTRSSSTGHTSVGVVLGNPNVHTMAGALYPPVLLAALRTRSLFTASTLDQMPKHVSSGLLFGDAERDPGARPRPHRPSAAPRRQPARIQRQPVHGPRLPRQAQGAAASRRHPHRRRPAPHPHRPLADRHVAIRPGTDALLLAALTHVLFEEKLTDPGDARRPSSRDSTK